MADHGLTSYQIDLIKSIFAPFAKKIDFVGLFGSRATGLYRVNSDIDMVIYGSLTEEEIDRLWTLFDASDLPVKVDLKAYNHLLYPPLKQHIDAVMRPLLSKEDLERYSGGAYEPV